MRLGAPLGVTGDIDPEVLAEDHYAHGYRAAFFPWDKSCDDQAYLQAMKNAFARRDIAIAEVIGWRNMIPDDPRMQSEAIAWLTGQLAVAEEVGARCCVSFGGTVANDLHWTAEARNLMPEAFDRIVENTRKIIDAVKPRQTRFTLEMMPSVFPDNADNYLRLIKAIDRPGFAVHLDPVNLVISPSLYFNTGDLIRDCFRKLGPWIRSCHAKDVLWMRERGFRMAETVPGRGVLDFHTYLRELRRLDADIPLLVEHLNTPEEYREGCDFIRAIETQL